MASQKGPGLIFSQLIPVTHDYSLYYSTYPFNALLNPALSMQRAQWCALVTDRHYQPLLLKLFPDSQWISLPTSKPGVEDPAYPFFDCRDSFQPSRPFELEGHLRQVPGGRFQILQPGEWKTQKIHPQKFIGLLPLHLLGPLSPVRILENSCPLFLGKNLLSRRQLDELDEFFQVFQNRSGPDSRIRNCARNLETAGLGGQTAQARDVFNEALKLSPGNPWLLTEIQQLGLESK